MYTLSAYHYSTLPKCDCNTKTKKRHSGVFVAKATRRRGFVVPKFQPRTSNFYASVPMLTGSVRG